MERFKAGLSKLFTSFAKYLHSNMERFKAKASGYSYSSYTIYIPIWRDLKILPYGLTVCVRNIYIPIWRDLKSDNKMLTAKSAQHLHSNMERFKASMLLPPENACCDLHSNMERFKGGAPAPCTAVANPHLHSNMERFKGEENDSWNFVEVFIYIPIWRDLKSRLRVASLPRGSDLHSNMERFKAVPSVGAEKTDIVFTFQYGEI